MHIDLLAIQCGVDGSGLRLTKILPRERNIRTQLLQRLLNFVVADGIFTASSMWTESLGVVAPIKALLARDHLAVRQTAFVHQPELLGELDLVVLCDDCFVFVDEAHTTLLPLAGHDLSCQ